jgi:hypothetical protein
MRIAKSCAQCRTRKRRCEKDMNLKQSRCKECAKRNLECSLGKQWNRPRLVQSGAELPLPDPDVLIDVVNKYFRYLHDLPHSLFHKCSFIRSVENGSVHKSVIYAIIGLTARFSEVFRERTRYGEEKYMNESKRLLLNDAENICVENIQAAIIIVNVCFAQCLSESEAMFASMAVRMAQILHLDEVEADDPLLVRETKRRVWWSLYMVDRWSSGNLGIPRLIRYHDAHASMPMPGSEADFQMIGVSPKGPRTTYHKATFWAEMIRLARIFGGIQDLNRRLVSEAILPEDELRSSVSHLAGQLQQWHDALPQYMIFNEQNLDGFLAAGLDGPFLALHLGYNHYATILCFQFLDETQPPTETRKSFSSMCAFHARCQSRVIELTSGSRNCLPLYNAVGHMVVVSSSVLLHNLLFGELEDIPRTRNSLETNFKALILLKRYWPNIDTMIGRLQLFQDACKLSSHNAFQMDKWMLKFLLQYSISLEEKTDMDSVIQQFNYEVSSPPEGVAVGDRLVASLQSRMGMN